MKTLPILMILLISFPVCSQIQVRIDSINTDRSNPSERRFTVVYSISNTTDDTISFFLKMDRLQNNVYGSMSNSPCYKLYSAEEIINNPNILQSSEDNQTA